MDSAPPAMQMEALEVIIVWAARIKAFTLEAHTLFTVVQTVE